MQSPPPILRHVLRADWRCKHCSQIIGSERLAHYGIDPPDSLPPTWFFAAMTLLDHLRDCQQTDFSPELTKQFGPDFLNHPKIYDWYNQHALIERTFVAQEELD